MLSKLEKDESKISAGSLSAMIKAFWMYPRLLSESFETGLKITLYNNSYDLKDSQMIKLSEIFVKIDK